MKFLGELYLLDVHKLTIMVYHCLNELLKDEEQKKSLKYFASTLKCLGLWLTMLTVERLG
jgi:hypothetical protein